MTTYLARSAWTSTPSAGASLSGSILRGVAVHWPGTTQDIIGDPGQASIANRIRSYRNFHVNSNGWSDIGYNFAIDQAGRVWMLRSTSWAGNRVGAHCASRLNPDANHEYVGVLLILGNAEQPSPAMLNAFRDWYRNRFLPIWVGRTDVRGHGKVPGASTSCPGARALNLIASGALTSGTIITPEDEVELTDRIPLLSDAHVKWSSTSTTVQGAFTSLLYYVLYSRNVTLTNQAALAGLTAAVAALAADPDLDEARITEIVKAAAAAGVAEAGADEFVDELVARLTAGDTDPVNP